MKKFYFTLLVISFLVSCEKDELFTPNTETNFNQSIIGQIDFKNVPTAVKNSLSDGILAPENKSSSLFGPVDDNLKVTKIKDGKKRYTYTFPLKKIKNISSHKNPQQYYFDNAVIRENFGKVDQVLLIRYIPDLEWINGNKNIKAYSGSVLFYDAEGTFLNRIEVNNQVSTTPNITNKATCYLYLVKTDYTCSGIEGSMDPGDCRWISYYQPTCIGGASPTSPTGGDNDGGMPEPESIPSVPTEGGDFDPGAGSGNPNPLMPEPVVIEITVDLEGRELCAYNRLQWAGVNPTNGYINMMTQLFIEFGAGNIGDVDLVITERNLGYRGGNTNRRTDGKFEIVLSQMENSSSIEIAAVLVHEMAHAFLGKHYLMYNESFEKLYEKYLNDHGLANFSHNIMEDKFINRMAQVLYDYDSTLFSNFNDYKILASAGVYEFDESQLSEYNRVRTFAENNDERCQNEN